MSRGVAGRGERIHVLALGDDAEVPVVRAWPPAPWRAGALVRTWRELEVAESQPVWGELASELDSLLADAFAAPLSADAVHASVCELAARWQARANAIPPDASEAERQRQAVLMKASSRTLALLD